ncbi:MAG: hypothetical protein NT080_14405 [Spirochaetes bacterium]|nr:hypothetical protein [Spirochaetota bacterium]
MPKRLYLLGLILVVFAFPAFPDGSARAGPIAVSTAPDVSSCYKALPDSGSRFENSESLRLLLAHIASRASGLEFEVSRVSFDADTGIEGHSFSELLRIDVPGTGEGVLVIEVPVSARPDGDVKADGSLGAAVALSLMGRYAMERPKFSVRFLFSGVEYGAAMDDRGSLGPWSRLGARKESSVALGEKSVVVVHLELDSPGTRPRFVYASAGILAPFWYRELVASSLAAAGFNTVDTPNRMLEYRLGLVDDPGPLQPWMENGFPAVGIMQSDSGEPDTGGFPAYDRLVNAIESVSGTEIGVAYDSWDKQYLLFALAGWTVVVRERYYVISLLSLIGGLIALLAVSSVVRRKQLLERVRLIPGFLFGLALLFTALVLTTAAAGMVFRMMLTCYAPEDLVSSSTAFFVVARLMVLLAAFMTAVSAGMAEKILSPHPSFFMNGAMLVLAADVLIFSAVRLSLSIFFFWALAFAIAAVLAKTWWADLAACIAAPLPVVIIAWEAVRSPQRAFFRPVLFPTFPEALSLSIVLFPFFLLLAALAAHAPVVIRRSKWTMAIASVLVLSAVIGVEHLHGRSIAAGGVRDAILMETLGAGDTEGTVHVLSGKPLPEITLLRAGCSVKLPMSNAGQSGSTVPGIGAAPRLTIKVERILGRRSIVMDIDCDTPPYRLSIDLPGADPISVYECSLPVFIKPEGKGIGISVGPRPPMPLELKLAVAEGFESEIRITAIYLEHPRPWAIAGRSGGFRLSRQRLVSSYTGTLGARGHASE